MPRLLTRARFLTLHLIAASALAAQNPQSATQAAATSALPRDPGSKIANDPDVLGAERLFSAWLDGQIAYKGIPGVVVGVVSDQDLIWTRGYGFADVKARTPMSPGTKFRMASHSKLFTATSIMQLREQGKVRLDDPVSKYLTWFKVKPTDDDDGEITIEQLLTHSSGLPREAGAHWTTLDFPTEDQIRALIADRQAAFPPQTRFKYSNLAYTIAGIVVEQASGEKYADYVQRHIFDPLGMTSSSVDKNVDGLAVGYTIRRPDAPREVFPFVDAHGMAPATGITSTVGDMAKFVSAQFRTGKMGGDRILGTASLREMHRVRALENNWTNGYAIGFAVSHPRPDRTYIGHGGSYPGYTTQTTIDPEAKVGVIVLTNTNDSDPGEIARQLMNSVGEAVAKTLRTVAPTPKMVAWDPSWTRFAGLYRSRNGDSYVVPLNGKLVILNATAANLDNVVTLEPLGDGRFRYTAPGGGGPVGEVVRFVEEGGRVVRMITGDSYMTRVSP